MRSSNCPERPTNGRPCLSSSAPGASPTSISREPGVPSAKTRRLAEPFRPQPSKRSRMARSSSRLAALRAASRAAITAASGAGGAATAGRAGALLSRGSAVAPVHCRHRSDIAGRISRLFGGRRRLRLRQQIVGLLADRRVDAGLGVEGEQLTGGFAAVGGHVRHILCRTPRRVSCYLSPAAPADIAATRNRKKRHGRRHARPRVHGVRRRHRRRRPGRARRRDPAQAARSRSRRGGGREGLRGRRAYPLGRGDRSDRARPAHPGMADRRHPDQDRGARRPLLLARAIGGAAPAEHHDAAADVEPRQLHRLARQRLPLARHQGRGARRRNLSGLRRRRSADRRQRRGDRRRHRRHGHRQGRQAAQRFHPRHGAARQVHAVRRRRARQPVEAVDREIRSRRRPRAAEIRPRLEGALAGRAGQAPARPGAALVRLAARQFDRRRFVPLSLRRQSGFGRLRRSSQLRQSVSVAVRGIPALQDPSARSAPRSRAASGCPTARASSPRAATSRCRSCRSRAAR